MDYANESWIVAKTRDTLAWRVLSLGARSLHLEMTRALGRFTDEFRLGSRGLETVATLVGAPWSDVEPWLHELLQEEWLTLSPDGKVLREPRHLERQGRTSPEYFVKLYTRNTAAWLALSLRARGLSLELTRHMGRAADRISLGSGGLAAVAALVSAPWDEVEPCLHELLIAGRLVHDETKRVLRDPDHMKRQRAKSSGAQRVRDHRNAVKRGVTQRNAAPAARNDQKEQEQTPARESRESALTPVHVVRGMKISAEAEAIFAASLESHPRALKREKVWRAFVNEKADSTFKSEQAFLGAWENWVDREEERAPRGLARTVPESTARPRQQRGCAVATQV